MQPQKTRSTSPTTLKADPIVIRQGERTRLVFVPRIINNFNNPEACVSGYFVYEKKAQKDAWIPIQTLSLAKLKRGEGYTLDLDTKELHTLMRQLKEWYTFYEQQGVPTG